MNVITGLGLGGAEMMMYKVLTKLDRARHSAEVVSLSSAAHLRPQIEALGVPVTSLDMDGPAAAPLALLALRAHIAASPAAVVQTWMFHADLLGGLAARWAGRPVLWNIQGSNLDPRTTRRATRVVIGACARLSSHVPARIVSCGHATARTYTALGYDETKIVVIPNAVDTQTFRPDAAARASLRAELGLPADAFVVGLGARFDPQKDHETMLAAWGQLHARGATRAHLLLFGKDLVPENAVLAEWIARHGASQVHLLGPRPDVPRLFAGCDASCLSSAYGEGLPNIVAEAMACGLPCVVTDVGDSAWVVGDTGFVAPPRDAAALADGLWALASMSPEALAALGARARRRVETDFDLDAVAARYYALYDEISTAA